MLPKAKREEFLFCPCLLCLWACVCVHTYVYDRKRHPPQSPPFGGCKTWSLVNRGMGQRFSSQHGIYKRLPGIYSRWVYVPRAGDCCLLLLWGDVGVVGGVPTKCSLEPARSTHTSSWILLVDAIRERTAACCVLMCTLV